MDNNNERKYVFFNKNYGVRYDKLTREELDVLNHSYRQELYMDKEQYVKQKVWVMSALDTEDSIAEEYIGDNRVNVEQQVTTEFFMRELFASLNNEEKRVVTKHLMEGYLLSDLAEEMGVSYRQVARYKKKALEKLNLKMKEMGINSYGEAVKNLLWK